MNDINLPFEEAPMRPLHDEDRLKLSGGLVVMAGVVPVLDKKMPAIIFRFFDPRGKMYDPIGLVVDEHQMRDLKVLVEQAVDAAIKATE